MTTNLTSGIPSQPSGPSIASSGSNNSAAGAYQNSSTIASHGEKIPLAVSFGPADSKVKI